MSDNRMRESRMGKRIAAVSLVTGLGAAACAPATIVRDPMSIPAAVMGAAGLGQAGAAAPPAPGMVPLSVLQADFRAKAGSDTIRFGRDEFLLDDAARRTLALQADWLRVNPWVRASIEGHGDVRQTREHALALGERRAAAVHSFLLAQGVPPAQLSVISWGKERPAVDGAHEAAWLQNSRVVVKLESAPSNTPFGAPPLPGLQPATN